MLGAKRTRGSLSLSLSPSSSFMVKSELEECQIFVYRGIDERVDEESFSIDYLSLRQIILQNFNRPPFFVKRCNISLDIFRIISKKLILYLTPSN